MGTQTTPFLFILMSASGQGRLCECDLCSSHTGPGAQKGPALGQVFSCHCIEILNF